MTLTMTTEQLRLAMYAVLTATTDTVADVTTVQNAPKLREGTLSALTTLLAFSIRMDTLTRKHTAFQSWADMRRSLDAGYVPTLRDDLGAGEFRKLVQAEGYRTFAG